MPLVGPQTCSKMKHIITLTRKESQHTERRSRQTFKILFRVEINHWEGEKGALLSLSSLHFSGLADGCKSKDPCNNYNRLLRVPPPPFFFFCWNNCVYFCFLTYFPPQKNAGNWWVSGLNASSLFHAHFKASPISKWLTLHPVLSTAKATLAFVPWGQFEVLTLLLFPVAVLPQPKSHMDVFSKYQALFFFNFICSHQIRGCCDILTPTLTCSHPAPTADSFCEVQRFLGGLSASLGACYGS